MRNNTINPENSNKHIMMMSLCYPQPCLNGEEYIEVTKVETKRAVRISQSKGNINLTDFWITTLEALKDQDNSNIMQNITLLGDEDSEWWNNREDGKNVCFAFFKVIEKYKKDTESIIKKRISDSHSDGIFYYTFGNADFIYIFNVNQDNIQDCMETIKKETNNGEETVFFSINILYGTIERDTTAKAKWKISHPNKLLPEIQKHDQVQGWSTDIIQTLNQRLGEYIQAKNKKMASYYHALLQIIKVISQYEQQTIYKDLFFMFYPPCNLFIEQLKAGIDNIYCKNVEQKDANAKSIVQNEATPQNANSEKYEQLKKIEMSISEFLDAMEISLHHIGFSCRDIFNDIGHGGITYDIPIRLCLMYVSYINIVTSILNDKKNYEYQYCLAPLAYSRPTTNCLDFGLGPQSRLVRVQISRSTMFMPRSLLIILAHEVSHYVGDEMRERKDRASCFIDITIKLLCHYLFSDEIMQTKVKEISESENGILNNYISEIKQNIYKYLRKHITDGWKSNTSKMSDDEKYLFRNMLNALEKSAREVLEDRNRELESEICKIDAKTTKELRKNAMLFSYISSIQERLIYAKAFIWDNEKFLNSLYLIAKVFREAYADISAILILKPRTEYYLEAFGISEGCELTEDTFTSFLLNRIAVVKCILEADTNINRKDDKTFEEAEKSFVSRLIKKVDEYIKCTGLRNLVQNYMCNTDISKAMNKSNDGDCSVNQDPFYNIEILKLEIRYLVNCYKALKRHLFAQEKSEVSEETSDVAILRKLFSNFVVNESGKDNSFEDFFSTYEKMINRYKALVVEIKDRKTNTDNRKES